MSPKLMLHGALARKAGNLVHASQHFDFRGMCLCMTWLSWRFPDLGIEVGGVDVEVEIAAHYAAMTRDSYYNGVCAVLDGLKLLPRDQ